MPWLDFSDVLLDPAIAGETFSVIRRQQVVDNYGTVTTTNTTLSGTGSITPTGDNSLVREEAYQTSAKTIKVITNFRLYGPEQIGGTTYQPDLVAWHGDNFIVKSINDYSSYGAGFLEAECASIDFVDQAI
jgi:galactose-6-phosphate isomerase